MAFKEKKSRWASMRDSLGPKKSEKEQHEREYRSRVRTLLREHIETMAEIGIVFHHTFESEKLGFAIVLARYGEEGREFINIEETMAHCEIYPGPLKPTDELIAVNGKVILEPSLARFRDLQKAIVRAARPLKLTSTTELRRPPARPEGVTLSL